MKGLDAWLEAPYVQASIQQAEYENWCEAQNLAADEDNWEAFEKAQADSEPDIEIPVMCIYCHRELTPTVLGGWVDDAGRVICQDNENELHVPDTEPFSD